MTLEQLYKELDEAMEQGDNVKVNLIAMQIAEQEAAP